jgi:LmbE family N-acetylglucosaminyl deacetylase
MGVVLAVSPHPDDEILGAGATLMALRDAGWRVVNLACSLGRPEQHERRRAELVEACRRAGFDLVVPDGFAEITRDDDLDRAQRMLSALVAETVAGEDASLVVGPSPHDNHPGHEVVGRAIRDAVATGAEPADVMFWGLWGDLRRPNVLVGFGADRLAELQHALAAHAGELARNGYDRLLAGRATANAVLGPERVFGFGSSGREHPYAELLRHVKWTPNAGWRTLAPRELDPAAPLAAGDGHDSGW